MRQDVEKLSALFSVSAQETLMLKLAHMFTRKRDGKPSPGLAVSLAKTLTSSTELVEKAFH